MLRKAAVLATAGAVLLSAGVAAAQGAAPNANPAAPNMGAGAAGGAGANVGTTGQQTATAEFTGTIKEWNDQEKVLTMDTGDKFYMRAGDNAPVNTGDVKVGSRVKISYVIDTGALQGEKLIRSIAPAADGGPAPTR
jgi:hypothetical protein